MIEIVVEPPVAAGAEVRFRFSVEPASKLYRRPEVVLRLPPGTEAERLPARLLWTAALACLHGQWALLRPCRVRLRATLPPGEVEVWRRLAANAVLALEAHRQRWDLSAGVEIVEDGPPVPPASPLRTSGRWAACFSGGKDSLLQASLLCELAAEPPLLVATTSPMPGTHDHETPRRRYVLEEIACRLPVEVVEVASDVRSSWDNLFAQERGDPVGVNEVSDCLLYLAAALLVGAAAGARHIFIAAEAEVHETAALRGTVVPFLHFMYAGYTLRALSSLVAPLGMSVWSAIAPLRAAQVQRLLWRRYGGVADLQTSCWKVGPEQSACSGCGKCLRAALGALAVGGWPGRMGIDTRRLIAAQREWSPRPLPAGEAAELPNARVTRDLHAETVRAVVAVPPARLLALMARHQPRSLLSVGAVAMVRDYSSLHRRLRGFDVAPEPGWRSAYLPLCGPPQVGLAAIFAAELHGESPGEGAAAAARLDRLSEWLTAPLVQVA